MSPTPPTRPTLLFEQRTGLIRQTAFEIHVYFGPGFLEKVYQNALLHRLRLQGLGVRDDYDVQVRDQDGTIVGTYSPDLAVDSEILVELKAARALTDADSAQVLNYLKATGKPLGLLINFGAPRLEFRRFVRS